MNKIRTLIVDDEPLARLGMRQLLTPHVDIELVGEARNGLEAIRALRELQPDLVFLDVQMPKMDGFGVLREMDQTQMPFIVFVTAYDEFAVRAFEARALDYLVKPLERARFLQTLERVREQMHSSKAINISRQLSALLAAREKQRVSKGILVHTPSADLVIDAVDINWIEAADYYAAIHARRGRHLVRESLASLEQRLDRNQFFRAHRSAIVNVDFVSEMRREDGETWIVLRNGLRIPVSRRRRARVTKLLRRLATGPS